MHESKTIRPFAMEYMQLTMKSDDLLTFVLERFEKYDVPITEIVDSIFDREAFAQWHIYGNFLQNARNKARSVTVITEVIKKVLILLTDEYQADEKINPHESGMPDAKIDILEFLRVFPKFLVFFSRANPHLGRYVKTLGMVNAINLGDFTGVGSDGLFVVLKDELLVGLKEFETFSAINGLTEILLKLSLHFEQFKNDVVKLLVYHSSVFVQENMLSTPEGAVKFKRATYFIYTVMAHKKQDLIENENYEALFNEELDRMLDEEFLAKVPAKGAVLAVWALVLGKCFKLAVDPARLDSIETYMKTVLEKMRAMMMKAVEKETVTLYSDMKLILLTAGNLMHFLWTDRTTRIEPEHFTLTFTWIVKLTEMMLIHTDFPEILPVFNICYDVHYDIIPNHEEITLILQHFGQPYLQKHTLIMHRLLCISHHRDPTEEKTVFRRTIAQTLIHIASNSIGNTETKISLFWRAFHQFTTSVLKLKPKDFLQFIATLSFLILQTQLRLPRDTDDSVNRFQIFEMIPQIVEEMRKSVAVVTSVKEFFIRIQEKHESDFSPDENQSIKAFLIQLTNERHRSSGQQESNDD